MNNEGENKTSQHRLSGAQPKVPPRRKPPLQLVLMRLFFKSMGSIFPRLIGHLAYRLWFGTRRYPTPKREQDWISSATCEALEIKGLAVMTYFWQNAANHDAPLILLVHGWDGRGSQMGAFAEPLLKVGFRVLAYDNPAHGQTPGKGSTLFIHSEIQHALVDKIGPVYAIVAHSFGGLFSAYSLSHNMVSQKIVSISAPSNFIYLLDSFCLALRLPDKVRAEIVRRFKEEFGEDLVERISATTTSQGLGHIPALIIHDENDYDVPISESENLHHAWPNSIFQRSQGLGHRRILYNPKVIQDTVNFLKSSEYQ